MKISNFKLEKENVKGYLTTAFVTVETGFWFWRKKVRKKVAVKYADYGGFWYFVETGKDIPGIQVVQLYNRYRVNKKLKEKRK